jgi:hypothetical protein
MPLDHFVSQVHLKNFISPALGNRFFAIRKSDMARFRSRPRDVCRIEDGSTNAYLRHDRAIEGFLKGVEPRYNAAVAALRDDKIDRDTVFVIAGFAAYVASCAPAAMRIGKEPLKAQVEVSATILDRQGVFERAPAALGGNTLTELLDDRMIHFEIDGKFPQALGIGSVVYWASVWGNSPWEVLHNGRADAPFFTSDFPIAIEQRADHIMNRIVPLAPDLAVRFIPDIRLSRSKPDLSFPGFRYRRRTLGRAEIIKVNRLIVQCAEDLVFFRDDRPWIDGFVRKHRYFRVDCITDKIPHGAGFLLVTRQRVIEHQAA